MRFGFVFVSKEKGLLTSSPTMLKMRFLIALVFAAALGLVRAEYFEVQVVDEGTGRGVPLVEVRTVDQAMWVTDSAGRVACDSFRAGRARPSHPCPACHTTARSEPRVRRAAARANIYGQNFPCVCLRVRNRSFCGDNQVPFQHRQLPGPLTACGRLIRK